ncbi:hypothetical protein BHE90_017166 [Fusarium euwallaceae]|uniref:Uncharacterized protein n=1 Tax=Fusarium euwallaceae TaxID=1147111 RepID=A0A430KYA2_9HYPO|nr:hypothetical protein BHE90_017166 [Fusarium euwallaceae]
MPVTKAAAVATAACLVMAPFDPTGTALLGAFIGTATTTAAGGGKLVKKGYGKVKERSDEKQSNLTDVEKEEYRDAIWKLSAAGTGAVVTGAMALVMPPFAIGLLLSCLSMRAESKKIKGLADKVDGHKNLLKSLSKADVAANIVMGAAVKGVVLFFLVGNDFDTAVRGISALADNPEMIATGIVLDDNATLPETALGMLEERRDMIDDGVLHFTTQLADLPSEAAKALVGLEDTPLWGDGTPFLKSAVIGVAAASPELLGKMIVEDPAQRGLNKK